MLGGGIQTMSITEVFGEFRTGKSQLSMTASVICQLPKDRGGADGMAAYIDTEGTFRPDRIRQISERFGIDADVACENILYGRALNSEHQLELLNELCQLFAAGQYRLLVSPRFPIHEGALMGGGGRLSTVSWLASAWIFADVANSPSTFPSASERAKSDGRAGIGVNRSWVRCCRNSRTWPKVCLPTAPLLC